LIETETARCGDIVRNLLLFSRRRDDVRAPADLRTVVERALALVHHQAEMAGITTRFEAAAALPPVVCNGAEIEQAVLALLINALEAMGDGGDIRVGLRHRAASGEFEIEVADTGPGIPGSIKSRVFEPFFSTKPDGKGTGLGLAVVYGIMQRHQGRIELDSEPGRGATFRLILPVQAPEVPASAEWTAVGAAGEGDPS
jgi:two-component system NtrC family sensor kinase